MLRKMIDKLKATNRRLVLPEGTDIRILEAARRLKADHLLDPILLGDEEKIAKVAEREGINIEGIEIINPLKFDRFDEMCDLLVEIRKGKMDKETAVKTCQLTNYFGTMLVKMGYADALLGGATYSTADTVRPALQIIKTKPGASIVSSCFILTRVNGDELETYVMGDCAINLYPTSEQLADIAAETAKTARIFGIEPRVALLSYSTMGSGKGESVDKVREATRICKEQNPHLVVDGELQFDAAFSPKVATI